MRTARDTGLLCGRSLVQLLRNPVWLVVGFSTPILYLALFAPLLRHLVGAPGLPRGHVLDGFLPGILALLAFASGSGPGFTTIFELKAGVIERLRVTPASRLAILLGPIVASTLMMFVFDAAVVAVGAAFGFDLHWLGLLVLGVLLALLLPISLGPSWIRVLAHVNPLYYLVAAARVLAAGRFAGPHVWQAFAVLVPVSGLVLAWATRTFRRAVA